MGLFPSKDGNNYFSSKQILKRIFKILAKKTLRAVSRENLIWSSLDDKMGQNGFIFRNLHEKLEKKML
jgi:hypothetical protein